MEKSDQKLTDHKSTVFQSDKTRSNGDSLLRWVDDDSIPTEQSTGDDYSILKHPRDSLSMADQSLTAFHSHHTPDELLMMEVQVHTSTTVSHTDDRNEDNWGLLDDTVGITNEESLKPSTMSASFMEKKNTGNETPYPQSPQATERIPVCVVSPSPSINLQLLRAKHRFALSMKRSDQTRWMVRHMYRRWRPRDFSPVRRRVYGFLTETLQETGPIGTQRITHFSGRFS